MKKNWVFDAAKFIYKELEDEYVLLNVDTSHYFTLEGTGNFVFKRLLEDKPLEAIKKEMRELYPAAGEKEIGGDVDRFVKDLKKNGILRPT